MASRELTAVECQINESSCSLTKSDTVKQQPQIREDVANHLGVSIFGHTLSSRIEDEKS